MLNRSRTLSSLAVLAALLGVAGPAGAQYRPPPMTEAQRLTQQGDDTQAEASKLLKSGDKKAAEEKYRKAIEQYEGALTSDPGSVTAAAGLGASGNQIGDYARVVKDLGPVNAATPDDLDVAFQLGVALYKLKRYDEGVPLLEKVSPAKKPEHLLGHYYLGYYYLHQQRGAPAVTELNRYFELRPQELQSKDAEIYQLLGRAYLLLRRPDYARASFERAQKGLPESISIQMGLEAVLEMEGRLKDAIALLEGLMARNPKAPEPRERLGRLLMATGDLARAQRVATELTQKLPSASAQLLLGDVLVAQRQGAAAEGALRKALQLAPGNLPVQISLAKALQLQHKDEEAIALLEGAAKAGADTVDLWAALGTINRRAGHVQRAVEMHQRVLQLAPSQPLGHQLLGADHFATGQWDQAIEDYEAAFKLARNDPAIAHWLSLALQHRARLRADSGRLDEAVPDLRRALDLEPGAGASRNLAAVLMSQKSYADALPVLDRGLKLNGVTWRDHQLRGYALLATGDAAGAVTAFEAATRLTQEPEEQAEIDAGWALAKLELGELDSAVAKMSELGGSKKAGKVGQENLPLALLRRALEKVRENDAAAASRDLESFKKVAAAREKDPEVASLANFIRALVDVEEGRYAEALTGVKRSLAAGPHWARTNARQLLDAYIAYRQGRFADSRKTMAQLQRRADPKQAEWMAQLGRAVNRREGERAYAQGAMAPSERALKAAAAAEPKNPVVLHNLACIQYRKGKAAEAVATWEKVEGSVPEAALNLGIEAQERRHDAVRAVGYYRKYVASNGPRASLVREWKERLQNIYGIAEPSAGEAEATGGTP